MQRSRQVALAAAAVGAMALLGVVGTAGAAKVAIEVSSREVYVNLPFVVSIVIEDAREYEPPVLPEIPGLRLHRRLPPSSSSVTNIINGRMTHRTTTTLNFQFVADKAGVFMIPPITVVIDDQEMQTRPLKISATMSQTDDLLFLEVKAERDRYYLGQRINLTLEIWLRPYRDEKYRVQFDEREMVTRLDRGRSTWGPFESGLDDIRYRETLRLDSDGIERAYYVYLIRATLTPRQTGKLRLSDVRILVSYPTQIRRSRNLFNRGSWETVRSRQLLATVDRAPIEITSPPTDGRPPAFEGAVGRFGLDISAKPTDIAVGDPITLTITITDNTPGGTDLDLLKPPPLERASDLTKEFRIPTDPLAGVVSGRRKTFTQTIRARSDETTAIPPIPFAYFDPFSERYVTLESDRIPIAVEPSAALGIAEIVGGQSVSDNGPTELTEVAGGILANFTGADLLVSRPLLSLSAPYVAATIAPPLLFGVFAVGLRHTRRRRQDRGLSRRRSARRRALRRLQDAGSDGPRANADATAAALAEYVADRCNLPAGALTGEEVVEQLRARGAPAELLTDVETLLEASAQLRYAGEQVAETDSIAERVVRCIDRLERVHL